MTVEAGVAIIAALLAGSVALLGFGLDSLIELVSASTILWLYTGHRSGSQTAERRAQQLIATCFAALAALRGVRRDRHARWRLTSRRELARGGCVGRGDHPDAAARPRQGRCRRAARLRCDGWGRGTVLFVRDQRCGRAPQHPCQRRARLVVAGPDSRTRDRRTRRTRGTQGVGGRGLRRLRSRGL